MELKEFITETLSQITEGVAAAQLRLKDTGVLINPEGFSMEGGQIKKGYKNEYRQIQNIKMTIAVTVTEESDSKAGIGVMASVFKAGKSIGESEQNQTINRIEFEIPIALPVMENA
jgi:hypothetical protein